METYLAPAHVYVAEDMQQIVRVPGVATRLACALPPGMSCSWPRTTRIMKVDADVPASWQRVPLRVVPSDAGLDLDTILGIVILERLDGSKQMLHVLPDGPPEWEQIEVAVVPDDFWNAYGAFYRADGHGEYLPPEYRVSVSFARKPMAVPPTWASVEIP